jgi:hypothetical protein
MEIRETSKPDAKFVQVSVIKGQSLYPLEYRGDMLLE